MVSSLLKIAWKSVGLHLSNSSRGTSKKWENFVGVKRGEIKGEGQTREENEGGGEEELGEKDK